MLRRIMMSVALLAGLGLASGCSGSGAGMQAFRIGKNMHRKDTNLRVYLDGQEAKQSKLKKGLAGYAAFKVKEEVGTSPVFKYEIIDSEKFGYIKDVVLLVHQKFEADFSDIADYKIFPRDMQDDDSNMKPGVDYDLGNLGQPFKILDKKDNEVTKVAFVPGQEYLLVLTISADKSETIQIYFKTK